MYQSKRFVTTVAFGFLLVGSFVTSQFDDQFAYNVQSAENAEGEMNILDESRQEREVIEKDVIKPWERTPDIAIALNSESAAKEPLPSDCADLYDQGNKGSGVYTIYIGRKRRPLRVFCDMTSNGGGWTVLQKRTDGITSFYHGWSYYLNGFGHVSDEYWIGLRNMHVLTLDKKYTLRIDMSDFYGNSRYAEYTDFKVGADCEGYKLLSIGSYCGNAGDSLSYHIGAMFSTLDNDRDLSGGNCAAIHRGAWWYKACTHSNLNGVYLRGQHLNADGIHWLHWRGTQYSMRSVDMKIRPANFNL